MQHIKRLVTGTPLERPLRQTYRRVVGQGDFAADRAARAEFARFRQQQGASALRQSLWPDGTARKRALIVNHPHVPVAKVEAIIIKALEAAGFETVTISIGREDLLRYHRLAGASTVTWADFGIGGETDTAWVDQQFARVSNLRDCLALKYSGAHVGRFAIATVMRTLRIGQLDFADPSIRAELRKSLGESVKFALAGNRALEQLRPDCVFSVDRGYIGQGELFDLALDKRIDTLVWNVGYKSNLLYFKRHSLANERDHHASMSAGSLAGIRSMPWKDDYGRRVREELFRCYQRRRQALLVGDGL